MEKLLTITFIDQQKDPILHLFSELRETFNHKFHLISNQEKLLPALQENESDIIFYDITFTDFETSLQIFSQLCQSEKSVVIAVIPENEPRIISRVLQCNPFLHINKPYNSTEVLFTVKKAIDKSKHAQSLFLSATPKDNFCGIVGKSPTMNKLYDLISKIADDDFSTVLIRGESGTGKELVAKAIHKNSQRGKEKFVPVNCAAIPDELLESELFGHVKGAFTGATQAKQGRIKFADRGTLFLDEIGDMKPSLQAKLLRVLQEKEFEPVGGLQPTPVDTRILAATHCNLEKLVEEGNFREDLYYRLSVIPLNVPSLVSRREDIPLLIEYFIDKYTTARDREPFSFSHSALEILLRYTWRGNVRELENLVQHMSILFSGKIVQVEDLPEKYTADENLTEIDISALLSDTEHHTDSESTKKNNGGPAEIVIDESGVDFNEMVNLYEKTIIIQAMKVSGGNKKEAARILRLKRTTLLEKIKKKKLTPEDW